MKKKIIVAIIILVAIAAVLVIDFSRTSQISTLKEKKKVFNVTVRMKWFFAGTMTGWFSGKEEGIFEKNLIELIINPGGPQNSSIKLTAAGSDDFGVAGADEVLLARDKGIPVVAIAVLFKESPLCYISRESSGIKSPEDWRGKRIEVSYGENAEYQFRALLKKFGLKKEDYTEVPYSFSVIPFLEGKVDVSPAYAMDQAIVIENRGVQLRKIFAKDYGINPYADVIITTETTMKEKPEMVKRFIASALEAQKWAIQNPNIAVKHLIKNVPDLAKTDQIAVWKATIPYLIPDGDTTSIGRMTLKKWQETQAVLIESGILRKPVDLKDAFTNAFIK